MSVRLIAALALVAACGNRGDSKQQAGKDAAVGTSRAVAAPSAPDAAAPPASGSDDASFQALADGVAKMSERKVTAAASAKLAEDDRAVRYAILEPDDINNGRGAYLLEESPGKLWLVSYYYDGRTMAGIDEADRAVDHAQGHHHGGETVRFAFRGGAPVVLYHEYVDDAEEGEPEVKEYAKDGVCAQPCPALRGYATNDIDFQVVGPAATAAELVAKPQ